MFVLHLCYWNAWPCCPPQIKLLFVGFDRSLLPKAIATASGDAVDSPTAEQLKPVQDGSPTAEQLKPVQDGSPTAEQLKLVQDALKVLRV